MSPAHHSPSTAPPGFDAELEDELSEVRPRLDRADLRRGSRAPTGRIHTTITPPPPSTPPSLDSRLTRGDRIERKMRVLRMMQLGLDPSDPSRRLIRLALVRRDEILLDRLLDELSRKSG